MPEAPADIRYVAKNMRLDLRLIAEMVPHGAKLLDIGCGDGALIEHLTREKQADARGIEIDMAEVTKAVSAGLAVIHGDADNDLAFYPDRAFDYVVLSRTFQAVEKPREVLRQMLRIGRHAIVSFPNFGHWRMRSQVFFQGRMPVTDSLPYAWWDTPNIHFCTIRDFVTLCDQIGARKERAVALDAAGGRVGVNAPWWFWNLFGAQAVFLLKRG